MTPGKGMLLVAANGGLAPARWKVKTFPKSAESGLKALVTTVTTASGEETIAALVIVKASAICPSPLEMTRV